jgi:hypothetical protein
MARIAVPLVKLRLLFSVYSCYGVSLVTLLPSHWIRGRGGTLLPSHWIRGRYGTLLPSQYGMEIVSPPFDAYFGKLAATDSVNSGHLARGKAENLIGSVFVPLSTHAVALIRAFSLLGFG